MSNRNARRKLFELAGVEEDVAVALFLSSGAQLRRSEVRCLRRAPLTNELVNR